MAEQLSIFVQNEPGRLAVIVRALSEGNIDIRALSIADTTDFGVLRLLVNDVQKAKAILEDIRCIVRVTGVTVVAVPDEPGGLSSVLTLLETGNVDIEYMYSLIGRGADKAYMVFRVSDEQKLHALLKANGVETVSGAALGIH